jgi:hypothetical protein
MPEKEKNLIELDMLQQTIKAIYLKAVASHKF